MKIYSVFYKSGVSCYTTHDPAKATKWSQSQDVPADYRVIVLNTKNQPYNQRQRDILEELLLKTKTPKPAKKLDSDQEVAILDSATTTNVEPGKLNN
jgi:hypothetical protein